MTRLAMVFLVALTPAIVRPSVSTSTEPPGASPQADHEDRSKADPTDEGDQGTMSVWMAKKLKHSQAILRGLAMGDFEDVQFNAGRLKVLNRVEGFVRRKNPDYRIHLNTFSRLSAEIERQAEKRNIEGATLAFNQLTVSCVDCHKSLRNDEAEASETTTE